MDLDELRKILRETSYLLANVSKEILPGDGIETLDCELFFVVVLTDEAKHSRKHLIRALRRLRLKTLVNAGSYLEVGKELGDQGLACQLFAVGKVLKFWEVVTPTSLNAPIERRKQLAREGGVMLNKVKVNFLRTKGTS